MKAKGNRLNRRSFLKTTGAGLAGIALLPRSPVAENSVVSPRRILDFNHKWLFSDRNASGATTLEFNDSAFERITIPHTNKMLPWHGFDDPELIGDGIDATRVVFRVTDEFGAARPSLRREPSQ